MTRPTVFVLIASALQAALSAAPSIAPGRVVRDRLVPVITANQTLVNIRQDKADGRSGGIEGAPMDWASDYLIECYARIVEDGQAVSEAIDPLISAIWSRLATASALPAFTDLAVQDVLPDPRIEWDYGEGATPLASATLHVRIIHRTAPGDITAPWGV